MPIYLKEPLFWHQIFMENGTCRYCYLCTPTYIISIFYVYIHIKDSAGLWSWSNKCDILKTQNICIFKDCVHYFYQIFIFHQMIALQKLWKMFFISTKKLFSFLRYSDICISFFTSFSVCQPLLLRLFKDKSKVYDVINYLNKNLLTHFVWYLEKDKKVWHRNFVHW